jgi:hypothetical protein
MMRGKKYSITTRELLALLCVLAVMGMLIGFAIFSAQGRPAAPADSSCSVSNHHHRYADLRLALVEIRERDECGFRFNDLERPLSERVEFAQDFAAAEVDLKAADPENPEQSIIPRSALLAGRRGVVAYCGVCKMVFSFKTWKR